MKFIKFFSLFILIFLLNSCANNDLNKSVIKEKGLNNLKNGDALFAAKKFNEAETLFPQSEWAPKSALMAAYSYYTQDYYGDAIAELERFIRVYPKYKHL